jgi:hypothetical protein
MPIIPARLPRGGMNVPLPVRRSVLIHEIRTWSAIDGWHLIAITERLSLQPPARNFIDDDRKRRWNNAISIVKVTNIRVGSTGHPTSRPT